jgi:hypothetical protein
MHELQCAQVRNEDPLPSTQVLLRVYNTSPIVCIVLNEEQRVEMVSPQCVSVLKVKGSELTGLDKTDCLTKIQSCGASVLCEKDNLMFVK